MRRNPDFGFNLHDQDPYYAVEPKNLPAAMSFLSPAFNVAKDIDESRKKGMQVIVLMADILSTYVPEQIGKYSDAYMPSAFGDYIQSTGTSTILIESGNTFDDSEKEKIRKLNFTAILSTLLAVSSTSYKSIDYEDYQKIPFNKKDQLFDVIFQNARVEIASKTVTFDIGIRREFNAEIDRYIISDIGDLSQKSAYKTIDLQGKIIQERVKPGGNADFLAEFMN